MNMKQTNDFYVVATKVSKWTKQQLARICRKKGTTEYEMLQMMCDCLVRYMDDRHNLSLELEQAMSIFEHMVGWKDAYNLADPTIEREVCEAVYITCDSEGKKHGFRASLVRKPFFGVWDETNNVVTIYERMTEVLLPDIYRKLMLMAIDLNCKSIVELLHVMIDAQTMRELNGELRKDFEDASKTDNGRDYIYGQRKKPKQHRTPDSLASDQRIKFDDYDATTTDRQLSSDDMADDMGFRPHGVEW